MSAHEFRNGLFVPAGAAPTTTTETPETPEVITDMETESGVRPMRWTDDDRLETDPRGFTPVGDGKGSAATKRVGNAAKDADEAELLLDIQGRDRSHEVDSRKVKRTRKKARNAGKLLRLRRDADAVALRDARVRLWTTVAAMFAAVAALGWSTASVQQTAADGAAAHTAAWYLAFLVEPLISVGLLATIGVQAYAAMRGVVVDKETEAGQTLHRTQVWLLVLTVTLNIWPYVSPLWTDETFSLVQVIVHLVGPIVAVRMIHSLPAMWGVLESLPEPGNSAGNPVRREAANGGVTPPAYSENATDEIQAGNPVDGPSREDQITAEVMALIASGEWTRPVSAKAIREHFRCGTEIASNVRNRVNATTAS